MAGLSDDVSRFRRAIWRTLWVRAACRAAVVALWASGCAIVAARLLWRVPPLPAAAVLLSLVVTTSVAAWLARRRTPSLESVRAAIDHASDAHGLVIAEAEVPLDAERRRQLQSMNIVPPRVGWRSLRTLGLAAPAVLFVLATLLIPDRWLMGQITPQRRLDVRERVAALEERLDTLEDLQILPEDESEALHADLERVEKNAMGDDPAKTLESLEHIADRLERIAEDTASETTEAANRSSEMEAAASALEQAADRLSSDTLDAALRELAEMAEEAGQACEEIDPELAKKLDAILGDGLTRDELRELAESFSQCNTISRDMLEQLADAGLLDPSALEQAMGSLTPEQVEALAEMVAQCEGQLSEEGLEEMLALCRQCLGQCEDGSLASLLASSDAPGRGGISRGRADAELAFSGETDEHGATFRNEILPPGGLDPAALTALQRTVRGSGNTTEQSAASTGGGLSGEAGGGGAHVRPILPQHRGVVRDYFGQD